MSSRFFQLFLGPRKKNFFTPPFKSSADSLNPSLFSCSFNFSKLQLSIALAIVSSSKDKSIKSLDKKNKTELSQVVAENLAKKAVEKKITKIYFDRGLYKYHGRVKIFAETLRKNGMEF